MRALDLIEELKNAISQRVEAGGKPEDVTVHMNVYGDLTNEVCDVSIDGGGDVILY